MGKHGKREFDHLCGKFRLSGDNPTTVNEDRYASGPNDGGNGKHGFGDEKAHTAGTSASNSSIEINNSGKRPILTVPESIGLASEKAPDDSVLDDSPQSQLSPSSPHIPQEPTLIVLPSRSLVQLEPAISGCAQYRGIPLQQRAWSSIGPVKRQSELTSRFRVADVTNYQPPARDAPASSSASSSQQYRSSERQHHASMTRAGTMPPPLTAIITSYPAAAEVSNCGQRKPLPPPSSLMTKFRGIEKARKRSDAKSGSMSIAKSEVVAEPIAT
ncbi:hypothetical protein V1517DRAFT_313705 [Lipomyces orientalis]|uniref:Uncharacterized protein n=1 Tax=Lipomyces orientalis TaxID=1233043 RepID=A0ACC3TWK8_9ASCO